jgi:type VI secretion system secreted protein VgrG
MSTQAVYSQQQRLINITTPSLPDTTLLLERFTAEEEMSKPFQFRAMLLSTEDSVDIKSLVRKPATVALTLSDGTFRYFNAVFQSLKQAKESDAVVTGDRASHSIAGSAPELVAYEAILVPQVWFLSLDSNCRIFQNMTVQDIVTQILGEGSVKDFQFNLHSSYQPRDYCVQYRESSFNFISRLLEHEGIFYFFQHTQTAHTMIFSDNSSTLSPCPGQPTASYSFASAGWAEDQTDAIIDLDWTTQAYTGKAALTDYDFQKPKVDLGAKLGSVNEEAFDYPGTYTEMDDGERYTKVRLEEREAAQSVVEGIGRCRAFRPGSTFDLQDHYRKDLNQSYLLTSVSHEAFDDTYRQGAGQPHGYQNRFRAIPKTVSYRPSRITRKPVVQGPQPALVVGKAGEEIWVDNFGRVKVQFYWDRLGKKDENSSCWVRVSQIWAGKNWGWVTLPRIGQEVIVDFLEGDPDQPIITGRVYNADQTTPYDLPANQTQSGIKSRSSKGGGSEDYNEIRFEDLKDSEVITVHAQKDMQTTVEHDDTQTIQNNRTIEVDGTHTETITKDTTITITQGNLSLTLNQGNQSTKLDQGNQSTQLAMGNQSMQLDMGNQSTQVSLGKIETQAMQSIQLTVGENSILINQMGVTIKGLMVTIEGQTITQVKGDALLILKGGLTMIN